MTWPQVTFDAIAQLRVMHRVIPGSALVERVLDAPYTAVSAAIEDVANTAPAIDPLIRAITNFRREGDRLTMTVHTRMGRARMEGEIQPGWCWMQSRVGKGRLYVVGMAARPVGEGRTRYGHLEGMRLPGARLLRPWFRRTVTWDVDGVQRLTEGR